MNELTHKERYIASVLEYNHLSDFTPREIYLYVAYLLERKYPLFFKHLDGVVVLNGKHPHNVDNLNECFEFHNKILLINMKQEVSPKLMCSYLEDWIDNLENELLDGKNVENIIPFGLTLLFEGVSPFAAKLSIEAHYQEGNFAFVKTKVHKASQNITRVSKRGRRSYCGKTKERVYEREMLIERYGSNADQYKLKNKQLTAEFAKLAQQKMAPKVDLINCIFDEKILPSHYDISIQMPVIDKRDEGAVVLVCDYIKLRQQFCIHSTVQNWEVYNDGQMIWIRSRLSKYPTHQGGHFQNTYEDFYFAINRFSGLERVSSLPDSIIRNINPKENEPKYILSAPDDFYVFIPVNEDETEIIEKLPYSFLKVEKKKEISGAREYVIINEYDERKEQVFYFAQYDGKWISTTVHNPKIQLLLDSYRIVDTLTKDQA